MIVTNRQLLRRLRIAIADLYRAAGGTDPEGSDVGRFVADPGAARQARMAITMANRGQLRNGEAE